MFLEMALSRIMLSETLFLLVFSSGPIREALMSLLQWQATLLEEMGIRSLLCCYGPHGHSRETYDSDYDDL
tara:strand:+ start:106 stop:318 length:213 start_codon:yes stop_codon:yes gene_type:complete